MTPIASSYHFPSLKYRQKKVKKRDLEKPKGHDNFSNLDGIF
jgi:hypothetical protein